MVRKWCDGGVVINGLVRIGVMRRWRGEEVAW